MNFFFKKKKIFKACNSNCTTCADSSSCSSCPTSSYRNVSDLCKCNTGYYYSSSVICSGILNYKKCKDILFKTYFIIIIILLKLAAPIVLHALIVRVVQLALHLQIEMYRIFVHVMINFTLLDLSIVQVFLKKNK